MKFAGLAYTLMQRLREIALAGTEPAWASAATIRAKLLEIGASVVRNTRRVRILLASHHPQRETFLTAVRILADCPGPSAVPGTLINHGRLGELRLEFRKQYHNPTNKVPHRHFRQTYTTHLPSDAE
ncbi:putative transposase, IS4 family [Methylocaldum marinum]|uniref:Putative transposase, IS4 family n=1 Tax=Methylocaldum marinum TaxID=1432792 RepID=A0A250KZH3_9GAMM|nr:putative transposase, IS4 family [Methylocaldum marinum]